jgi:hypothetical protein
MRKQVTTVNKCLGINSDAYSPARRHRITFSTEALTHGGVDLLEQMWVFFCMQNKSTFRCKIDMIMDHMHSEWHMNIWIDTQKSMIYNTHTHSLTHQTTMNATVNLRGNHITV